MKPKAQAINGDLVYKTLDILDSVDGEKSFKKLKLTPLEYHTARLLLNEYWQNGEAKTFILAIANFFKRMGFTVMPTTDGVEFIITT